MIIGVPKEVKDNEFRVSVTPDGARTLCAAGHTVVVEPSAGEGSGFSDDDYRKAGARLATSKEQLFGEAELIVKVKEPLVSEVPLFRPGQTLFTYLHLAAQPDLTKALIEAKITAIAYETTEGPGHSAPMLTPMSEIAGRMAVQVGAHFLERLAVRFPHRHQFFGLGARVDGEAERRRAGKDVDRLLVVLVLVGRPAQVGS